MTKRTQLAPTPFPWKIGLLMSIDALRLKPRSFRRDAIRSLRLLSPPPRFVNPQNIPSAGPALLVMNHYTRPGFGAWWIALGISAKLPVDAHWMMTNGWTHSGLLNPLTRWFFPRLAQIYGFTTTPPMPPDPNEVEARARAVRDVLRLARTTDAVIAVAPEGRDHPGGVLGVPPPGIGRFIQQLSKHRERITPVGVYEDSSKDAGLCFNFGPGFGLEIPPDLHQGDRDRCFSTQVMTAIARQLPHSLRGEYGPP